METVTIKDDHFRVLCDDVSSMRAFINFYCDELNAYANKARILKGDRERIAEISGLINKFTYAVVEDIKGIREYIENNS